MKVVLVFAQGLQEVRLVPDERAVEQLMSAGLDPLFHDRVHSRDSVMVADWCDGRRWPRRFEGWCRDGRIWPRLGDTPGVCDG